MLIGQGCLKIFIGYEFYILAETKLEAYFSSRRFVRSSFTLEHTRSFKKLCYKCIFYWFYSYDFYEWYIIKKNFSFADTMMYNAMPITIVFIL